MSTKPRILRSQPYAVNSNFAQTATGLQIRTAELSRRPTIIHHKVGKRRRYFRIRRSYNRVL